MIETKWIWKKYIYIYAPSSRELAEFVKEANRLLNKYGYFFRIIDRRKPPWFVEVRFYHRRRGRMRGPVKLMSFNSYRELPKTAHDWWIVYGVFRKYYREHGFYGSFG